MTILDLSEYALDDTWEPTTVNPDEEYQLRIVSFLKSKDKNGVEFLMPFFEVVDEERCKEFGEYLPFPNAATMGEKELNTARRKMSAFLSCFDLGNNLDMESDVGKTGWAILGMSTDRDGEPVNKIKKFVTSR